ncbi:MAG: hypothetical protein R2831_04745 [Chitinophagaceae bacterium]
MKLFFKSLGLLMFIWLVSCREPVYVPKPRGYAAVQFPEKKYQLFNKDHYPYTFEYPVYAQIEKDSLFFDKKTENPWWININIPSLGGKIYLSYKDVAQYGLSKLLEDSYQMSHYHNKKADFINEPIFHTENNVHGIYYEVGGNAASAFQFFATDSHKHFLRGALYFDVTPNVDSLKPINQFLIEDIEHLIKTLKWIP